MNQVEAIEDGKIVKVDESYAQREGLPIIRKREIDFISGNKKEAERQEEEKRFLMHDLRKPLNWKKAQDTKGLVSNFHWILSRRRREMGISRKQLADSLGTTEEIIKALENGILPKKDDMFLRSVQDKLGVKIFKGQDGKSGKDNELRLLVEKEIDKEEKAKDKKDVEGDDIEIIE